MFFEISNLKIETNLDKNLENKLESLFCDSCNLIKELEINEVED